MTETRSKPIIASGVIIYTVDNNEVRFLLLQNAEHKTWGFAKGCALENEKIIETAIREVKEEAGVTLKEEDLDKYFSDYSSYLLPNSRQKKECIIYLCKKSISSNMFKCSNEHQDFTWANIRETIKLLGTNQLRRTIIRANQHIKS